MPRRRSEHGTRALDVDRAVRPPDAFAARHAGWGPTVGRDPRFENLEAVPVRRERVLQTRAIECFLAGGARERREAPRIHAEKSGFDPRDGRAFREFRVDRLGQRDGGRRESRNRPCGEVPEGNRGITRRRRAFRGCRTSSFVGSWSASGGAWRRSASRGTPRNGRSRVQHASSGRDARIPRNASGRLCLKRATRRVSSWSSSWWAVTSMRDIVRPRKFREGGVATSARLRLGVPPGRRGKSNDIDGKTACGRHAPHGVGVLFGRGVAPPSVVDVERPKDAPASLRRLREKSQCGETVGPGRACDRQGGTRRVPTRGGRGLRGLAPALHARDPSAERC
jgi:hypothetical protein